MELKTLKTVIYSGIADIEMCILWFTDTAETRKCSVEHAFKNYGDYILDRITTDNNCLVFCIH